MEIYWYENNDADYFELHFNYYDSITDHDNNGDKITFFDIIDVNHEGDWKVVSDSDKYHGWPLEDVIEENDLYGSIEKACEEEHYKNNLDDGDA